MLLQHGYQQLQLMEALLHLVGRLQQRVLVQLLREALLGLGALQ
jgi:hypothetical protein